MNKEIERLTALAISLRQKGAGYADIAKKIGKSYATARAYANRRPKVVQKSDQPNLTVVEAISEAIKTLERTRDFLKQIH